MQRILTLTEFCVCVRLYATVHDWNEVLGQSTLRKNSCTPAWLFNEKFHLGSKPVGRIRIVALFVVLVVDPGDGTGDNLLVVRHGCCVGLGQKQWSRLVIFYYWHQGFNISKEWKNTTSFCNVYVIHSKNHCGNWTHEQFSLETY